MLKDLQQLREKAIADINHVKTPESLEDLRVQLLGRKGSVTLFLKSIKTLTPEEKRETGKYANDLKKELETSIQEREKVVKQHQYEKLGKEFFDITLPGVSASSGKLHPLTKFIQEVEDTFLSLNFDVVDGPEVEDDYHNFTALNIPEDHPARDTQATFWIKDIPLLLRTQTSNVQIRFMEQQKPPLRIICPGRVFRRDQFDASHSPVFHQLEGLMVDETTNLSHLKGILSMALRRLLYPEIELRFRSSFFPFVEPGLEVDVTCVLCKNKGCSVCKYSGWIELLGCGMVHPNVLHAVGIDPSRYQGFAFGAGIERMLMIKHKIDDIRLFYENHPYFLQQFTE